MKNKIRIIIYISASVIAALMIFTAAVNIGVTASRKKNIISPDEATALKDVDFILVLGCGVRPDGTPSDMLRDRLTCGVRLYDGGASGKILVTGDHADEGYNEVDPMINFCIDSGIERADILSDPLGVSTYESISRALSEFGAKKIIIVTQEYHLYRALYIADRLGIEAYGVSADLNTYAGQFFRDAREIPARVKDFILANIFG